MPDVFLGLKGSEIPLQLYGERVGPGMQWLNILSHLTIAAAYFTIPVALFKIVSKQREASYRRVGYLFVLFIVACGTTHVLAVAALWSPMPELRNLVKVATALLSAAMAVVLIRLRPTLLRVPGIAQLEREITARVQAEQAAERAACQAAEEAERLAEQRLATAVENVQEYALYTIDLEGRVRSWEVGAERLFGYASEEVVGRPVSCFFGSEDVAAKAPEFAMRAAIETSRYESQGWRYRKDGSRFWANVILRPLRDQAGALQGFIKVTHDLTESRELESRFQGLLEGVPDAIVIVNSVGGILFVNRAAERRFGYLRIELMGKPIEMLVPDRAREAGAMYAGVPGHGRDQDQHPSQEADPEPGAPFEASGRRRDGSRFPVEFSLSPFETREGRVFLFSIRDVTEREKTEARFRALLEAVPDAIVLTDAAGVIQYVNKQAVKLYGHDRREMLGMAAELLAPERIRAERVTSRERVFAGEERYPEEPAVGSVGLRKDGSEFPTEFSFSPLETEAGKVFLFAVRDISERLKAETRFRALLESVPDAILMYARPDRITYVNRSAEQLYGYERSELLGQSGDVLIPERLREERRKQREKYYEGRYTFGSGMRGQHLCVRKDGTEFAVEVTVNPFDTPEGPGFLASIRDITERQKTEARFRALLESAPDAMVIVDSKGAIELVNLQTEKLFLYSAAELVGQSVEVLVPEDLHGTHGAHRESYFTAPKKREMGAGIDLLAVRKDGTQFPVEISLSPLEGPNGTSVTAAIRDVSERKAATKLLAEKMAQLRQSNDALEQFAHIASHDLQEPLRMVASYTQLLAKRYKGRLDADADEFIHYAVDGTQRMKRLIEDLLVYSRAGKGSPPAREFRSEGALQAALDNLHAAIEESHAVITHDELPLLVGGEPQLVQVFQNLVGNAIKYRGERVPHVHISAVERAGEREFLVSDNGIGIDRQYFDRIFQIFQRLHGRGQYEGTGIGLAICQRILQQQGGRIWVESEPGLGSTFHFALPAR